MLTSLRLGGYFARASGIVFGELTQCETGPDGTSVEQVLEERTRHLGVPVYANAPFGHGARNFAFILGAVVTMRGGDVLFQG